MHVEDDSSAGSSPILILDDVFAELDSARRHRLGSMVADAEQVLITCAVLSDIPEELGDYRLVSVTAGHAEYVQPVGDSVTDSVMQPNSIVSALAEGGGNE